MEFTGYVPMPIFRCPENAAADNLPDFYVIA